MFETPESWLERILAHIVAGVLRFNALVIAAAVTLTVLSTLYIVDNLGINTDTGDMLSPTLAWRQTYAKYKEAFPQYVDTIAVVVDGQTPGQAEDAASDLATVLGERTDLFEDVFYFLDEPHFRYNQLLYLDVDELEALTDQLAQAQPFLVRLIEDPSLRGFFDLLTQASEQLAGGESVRIGQTLDSVNRVVESTLNGDTQPLSWQELMSGKPASADDRRRVILVKPKLDFSRLLPGETAVLAIRELVREHGFDESRGVRVRLTGSAALAYEELDSVTRGAKRAGVLAFILVTICLIAGLRSPSLILATLLVLTMD